MSDTRMPGQSGQTPMGSSQTEDQLRRTADEARAAAGTLRDEAAGAAADIKKEGAEVVRAARERAMGFAEAQQRAGAEHADSVAQSVHGAADKLGELRSAPLEVRCDDGLVLHAEVDERAPYDDGTAGQDDLTLVFVHGYALSLDCWHFQREALRGKYRMVFYDQRSHGRSERSPATHATIDQLGDDLARVVQELVERHRSDQVLVIGQYIDQLDDLGERLEAPVIKGDTTVKERERLFQAFRVGEISLLVVSKVANFSIDLPEAAVAIQVSGTFGSRQEEAQRLGRLLRPKSDGAEAVFYTVVARDTLDQEFAAHRQRFLAEQGYAYRIVDADDVSAGTAGL